MPSLPRLYHKDKLIVQWADRLISRLVAGALGALRLSNVLYVDVAGVDATAQRGNIDKPYATVQAALNAAQDGDVIQVGPGFFTEPSINWPPELSVVLQGAGEIVTFVSESTGTGPAINHVPGALETTQVITIRDMRIQNDDAAAYALNLDGSASPTSLRNVYLDNLIVSNSGGVLSTRIAAAEEIRIDSFDADQNNVLFEEVSRGFVSNFEAGGYAVDFDVTEVHPAAQRGPIAHTSCIITELTVNNVAWAVFGKECIVGSIVGALTDDAVQNEYGFIDYSGRVVTSVAVTFDYQDDYHTGVRFDSAIIGTTFSVADSAGAGTERMHATARQAIFLTHTDVTINAGILCDLDLRGAQFDQESLVVAGSGAIDRTLWTQLVVAATPLVTPVVFANAGGPVPYPVQSGGGFYNYTVGFEMQVAADAPVIIVAKAVDGQDVDWTGAQTPNLGGDLYMTVHRPFARY